MVAPKRLAAQVGAAAANVAPLPDPTDRLAQFIAQYDPVVASTGTRAIAALRKRLPGAQVLVYDNCNALAVGFGPTERASEAVLSIAFFPRWVSLFFLRGELARSRETSQGQRPPGPSSGPERLQGSC